MNNLMTTIRQNLFVRLAGSISLLAIIVLIIGFWDLHTITTGLQEKRALLNERGNIQLNFEQVLDLYQREYNELDASLSQLIPETTTVITILDELDRKGKGLGLDPELSSLPLTEDQTSSINFIRYQVVFEGNTEQLLSYIKLLEELPVYTEIQTINSGIADKDFSFSQIARHQIVFDLFTK